MASVHAAVAYLLEWLRTFKAASCVKEIEDLSDGLILAQVLNTICDHHFSQDWVDGLNKWSNMDWAHKVSNLEKIVLAIESFLLNVQGEPIAMASPPDVVAIVKYDSHDAVFRLLQLVLCCAVNCDAKKQYIADIMMMEESVQHALMEALQQLMPSSMIECRLTTDQPEFPINTDRSYQCLVEEKLSLLKKCQELEQTVSNLMNEKLALQVQVEQFQIASPASPLTLQLQQEPGRRLGVGNMFDSNSASAVMFVRISQLQDQLTKVRNELYRVEVEREELKIKLADSLASTESWQKKYEVANALAEEALHLKDELDIAREELAARSHLSATVDQLKKRADEAGELRSRCVKLELENKVCIDRISDLEHETRLNENLRSQLELQKQQTISSRAESTDALHRLESAQGELVTIREELNAATREKARFLAELNRLQTCCERLQLCTSPTTPAIETLPCSVTAIGNLNGSTPNESDANPDMQSEIINLREELSKLRTSLSSVETDQVASDNETDDQPYHRPAIPSRSLDSSQQEISVANNNDPELRRVEQTYRGYLWKAREVIRLLQRQIRERDHHPSSASHTTNELSSSNQDEIARLRNLLVDKENVITNLENHHEQTRLHRECEERIFLSAWYNSCATKLRKGVEDHICSVSSTQRHENSTNEDQTTPPRSSCDSFLHTQRELHLKTPRGVTSIVMASE